MNDSSITSEGYLTKRFFLSYLISSLFPEMEEAESESWRPNCRKDHWIFREKRHENMNFVLEVCLLFVGKKHKFDFRRCRSLMGSSHNQFDVYSPVYGTQNLVGVHENWNAQFQKPKFTYPLGSSSTTTSAYNTRG